MNLELLDKKQVHWVVINWSSRATPERVVQIFWDDYSINDWFIYPSYITRVSNYDIDEIASKEEYPEFYL